MPTGHLRDRTDLRSVDLVVELCGVLFLIRISVLLVYVPAHDASVYGHDYAYYPCDCIAHAWYIILRDLFLMYI